jgi:tetratricopeptide (TPR) repeat protein
MARPPSWRVLMVALCLAPALSARAADDSAPSLAATARSECESGRREQDRAGRKLHFDRGQALAERAVALDDANADAHFALFCNLGELMRLDGENLSQVFQLRRLMGELDRTLQLNPNHVDAMAAKGTLLVRLPRMLGGDTARGEAMLRQVIQRDPNAVTSRLALANVCEARGDRDEAVAFATRALQIAREQGRADKIAEAQATLGELRAGR